MAPTFASAPKDFPWIQIKRHAQVSCKQQPENFFVDGVAAGTVAMEIFQAWRSTGWGAEGSSTFCLHSSFVRAFLTRPGIVAHSTWMSSFKAYNEGGF